MNIIHLLNKKVNSERRKSVNKIVYTSYFNSLYGNISQQKTSSFSA